MNRYEEPDALYRRVRYGLLLAIYLLAIVDLIAFVVIYGGL